MKIKNNESLNSNLYEQLNSINSPIIGEKIPSFVLDKEFRLYQFF